jgi:tRNA(Ile)-lysidine synthase TilS/MesJ
MNEDLSFERVRVRKILLPLLKELNPKIIETLARTACLLREDFEALQNIAEQNGKSLRPFEFENNAANPTEKFLLIKDLINQIPSIRRYFLRQWLKNERGDLRQLTAQHFEAIEQLISSRKSGKTVQLPGGALIVKGNGKLVFKNNFNKPE